MGRFGDHIPVEGYLVHVVLGNHILHQTQRGVVPNLGVEIRQLLGGEGAGRIVHIISPLILGHK